MVSEEEATGGTDLLREKEEKTPSPFESLLGSEALTHVLSFCDFNSALLLARVTSMCLRQELRGDCFLWKEMFHRQGFSLPVHSSDNASCRSSSSLNQTTTTGYMRETQKRRQLARNLLVPRSRKSPVRSCCFNLPNRCFSFVPVTPDGLQEEWDDPPPVNFECDSFILTSTACGGEIVALDPFHGTLAVYESCLDNAVASDEAMLEQAMLEAANLIDGNRENPYFSEEDIAGAVFDQRVYRNHNISQYKKPPFQVLFRVEEDIDLDACFPPADETERNGTPVLPEIDVGYHGIDSKSIFEDGQVAGTMVAVGRMFTKEIPARFNGQQQEQVCTELHMWTRRNSNPEMTERNPRNHIFGNHQLCRFPCSFSVIDLCATHSRIFVGFDSPMPRTRNLNDDRAARMAASTIVVYPMVPHTLAADRNQQKKQPRNGEGTQYTEPTGLIQCQAEVSSLAVCPLGGTLVVGTANGTCEVWRIQSGKGNTTPSTKRAAIINIKSSISKAFNNNRDEDAMEDDSDTATVDQDVDDSIRMRRTLLTLLNEPKIVSFHHPNHLPFSASGFVTLQHSSSGSSLLLWRKDEVSDNYKIVSMVNLPLSGITRSPRVFYDGRRILIFGQDHIGCIVLVYQVLASNDDIDLFQEKAMEETSGGVYNLTFPPRARFANRIRHAALGGLQYYDSIHMACNERFIVVNTKSGNLLSDSTSPYAEGLLVIDLHD